MKQAFTALLTAIFTIALLPVILPICVYFLFRIRQSRRLEYAGLPYQKRGIQ